MAAITKKDLDKMDPESAAVRLLLEKLIGEQEGKASDRFRHIDAQVEWSGSHITLPAEPAKMSLTEARDWLTRLEKNENEKIAVNEVIDCFPYDGAIAMMKALRKIYGWAQPVPPRSFFEAPPTMTSVDISPTERTTIIWGRFMIPGLEGIDGWKPTLATGATRQRGRTMFCINGSVLKKHVPAVTEIAEMTRAIIKEESIYRGKAVRLQVDDDGDLDLNNPPSFVDVSRINRDELIFSTELDEQIRTNLFTPIVHTELCRKHKIPLKRGILMEGPFGTGKTLCAYATAQLAQENGWTFLMIDRVSGLSTALNFAAQYQPCVVFCEDIDRGTTGERTAELDDILNVVDGISSKGKEIMVVLTSNAADKINRAMLRPGRLDAVLTIAPPDQAAAEKLIRLYARGLIDERESITAAAAEMQGHIPAVIRECVERAKLYAISHVSTTGNMRLMDNDLVHAARGMKHHMELLYGKPVPAESDEHKLGAALAAVIHKASQPHQADGANGKPPLRGDVVASMLRTDIKAVHQEVKAVRRRIETAD